MPLLGSRGAASLTGFGGLAKLGYLLRNRLRFRGSNSAYLNRTPASASNRTTWTWSGWIKRGTLGTSQSVFGSGAYAGSPLFTGLYFTSTDTLYFEPLSARRFVNNTFSF